MQIGSIVKWHKSWLECCKHARDPDAELNKYSHQFGIVTHKSPDLKNCWFVLWCDDVVDEVHEDYLEVICK